MPGTTVCRLHGGKAALRNRIGNLRTGTQTAAWTRAGIDPERLPDDLRERYERTLADPRMTAPRQHLAYLLALLESQQERLQGADLSDRHIEAQARVVSLIADAAAKVHDTDARISGVVSRDQLRVLVAGLRAALDAVLRYVPDGDRDRARAAYLRLAADAAATAGLTDARQPTAALPAGRDGDAIA